MFFLLVPVIDPSPQPNQRVIDPRLGLFSLWFNVLLNASVNPSTVKCYDLGWRYWSEFTSYLGVALLPSAHIVCSCFLNSFAKVHMAALTVLFCAHQFFERGKSASTVTGYLSGVAFHLNKMGEDASFLTNPQVTMVRAGLRRLQVQRRTKHKGKLPFSLEMVQAYSTYTDSHFSLPNFGISVSLLLAFSCLLRSSEYIPQKKSQHWLRACDVSFILRDGRVIQSHCFAWHWSEEVSEVVVHIRSSKTDQSGEGFNFFFDLNSSSRALVVALIKWAAMADLSEFEPFFSLRPFQARRKWCLKRTDVTHAMRVIALQSGFSKIEAKRFTPHSLRYGGASALAAANLPDYSIKFVGRWKSDAFLIYVKETCQKFFRIHEALADASLIPVSDVVKLARGNLSSTKKPK